MDRSRYSKHNSAVRSTAAGVLDALARETARFSAKRPGLRVLRRIAEFAARNTRSHMHQAPAAPYPELRLGM